MQRNEVVDLQKFREAEEGKILSDGDRPSFLKAGTVLLHGQYSIDGYLNCGGFGITYVATDSLGRKVVIKECFPSEMVYRRNRSMAAKSPSYQDEVDRIVRQFVTEAHNLANVRHENVVHVHQIFEENDTAYMAMDFVDGPDLLDLMDSPRRLAPKEVQDLTRVMLGAIRYIHELGMLHRDISPDNILVEPDGKPVLIDFGAARHRLQHTQRKLSRMKFVKDGYSPQEFYTEGSPQGSYSDLYSFAATLYHLISGSAPIDAQTRLRAISANLPDPCGPLAGNIPGYPARFLRAIDAVLSVLPEKRIQTADEWTQYITSPAERAMSVVSRPASAAINLFAASNGAKPKTAAKISQNGLQMLAASVAVVGVAVAGSYLINAWDDFASPSPASLDSTAARASFSGETEPRATGPRTMQTAAVVLPRFSAPSMSRSARNAPVVATLQDMLPVAPTAQIRGWDEGVTQVLAEQEVAGSWTARHPPAGDDPIQMEPITPESTVFRPETLPGAPSGLSAPEQWIAPRIGQDGPAQATRAFEGPRIGTSKVASLPGGTVRRENRDDPAFAERSRKSPDMPSPPAEPYAQPSSLDLAAVAPTSFDATETTSAKFVRIPKKSARLEGVSASLAPLGKRSGPHSAIRVSHSFWDVQVPFEAAPVRWDSMDAFVITRISPNVDRTVMGDWLEEGVVLFAFNGKRFSPDGSLADHFHGDLNVGDDGYVRATVKFFDPATSETETVELAVPAIRKTRLADGSLLLTRKEGGDWVTTVQSLGFATTDLMVGDVIVGSSEAQSRLTDAASVEAAFDLLVASGASEAEFSVVRSGTLVSSTWRLPGQ